MYSCFNCGKKYECIKTLCAHIKNGHFLNSLGITFTCATCSKNFQSRKSFVRHLMQHNLNLTSTSVRDVLLPNKIMEDFSNDTNKLIEDSSNDTDEANKENFTNPIETAPDLDSLESLTENQHNIEEAVQEISPVKCFVGNLYSDASLNRRQIDNIILNTSDLFKEVITEVKKDVLEKLPKDAQLLHSVENTFDGYDSKFDKYDSDYKRNKSFLNSECFVKPWSYAIGYGTQDQNRGGEVVIRNKEYQGEIVLLSDSLKKFFELPKVLDKTLEYVENLMKEKFIISNFVQGEVWQEVLKKYEKELVLPYFLFYDDFEVNNPLGSHSTIHNLGGVYAILPCLPPQFRSLLDNMFLVALFHSADKKEFGNDATLRPVIEDLKKLETAGIDIKLSDKVINVKFVLGLVTGDNLGLNSILGFVQSFNSNVMCRICKMDRLEQSQLFFEDPTKLRTAENYSSDLVEGNPSKSGIVESCIFNELKNYHVTKNVVVDLMHDLFEGICRVEISKILLYFVDEKKYFSLEALNERIQFFDYSYHDRNNRISGISLLQLKNGLKISSSEMITLVTNLPLMIGDLIPTDDQVWSLFLSLRKIVDILLAKNLDLRSSSILRTEIAAHHKLFTDLFQENLKPKHHFLVHYPSIIKKVGPPIHFWAMRGEAMHRPLKQVARSTTSRINIPKTIAIRHQLKFTHKILESRGFQEERIKWGPLKKPDPNLLSRVLQMNYYPNEEIFRIPWVEKDGVLYKENMIIISKFESEDPVFCEIKSLFIIKSESSVKVFFITKSFTTSGFDTHLYSFQICDENSTEEVLFIEQISAYPIPTNKHIGVDGRLMICIRTTFD